MTGHLGSAIGEPSFDVIPQPQGRPPIPSASASAPVSTQTTPGAAAAFEMSIEPSAAWPCGERSIWAWSCPARTSSSV